eukprot:1460144-Amphidinium_carterae.1
MVHKALQLAFLLACCVALVAFFITYVRWSKDREDSRTGAIKADFSRLGGCQETGDFSKWHVLPAELRFGIARDTN